MKELIGKSVIVRTVSYHYTGRIEAIEDGYLRLSSACWIADSGRRHDALRDGIEAQPSSEIEPYVHDCYVSLGAIVDITEIGALRNSSLFYENGCKGAIYQSRGNADLFSNKG